MRLPAIFLASLAAGCAAAPTLPPADPAASLAAAEAAFAAQSVREGMRSAFLAHFAGDGVLAHGGWANAVAYLAQHPDPPIVLDWRPVHVEVAGSGELGLSTGPWKLSPRGKPGVDAAYGQFVSIWRRDAGSAWKVVVDIGISQPGPALWGEPLQAFAAPSAAIPSASLPSAEAGFARDALRDGLRAAYRSHGSPALRFYRNAAVPAVGRDAALASSEMDGESLTWKAERIETSRSGDFGYARGSYAAASDPGVPRGLYLRVWRVESGAWRIVLDVADPLRS